MAKDFLDNECLLHYKGPFCIHILVTLSNYIKEMVDANIVVKNRIYKIFLEVAQNINYYSAVKSRVDSTGLSGVGMFSLSDEEDCFTMMASNIITEMQYRRLEESMREIQGLSTVEIRKLRSVKRLRQPLHDSAGHIGMIQIALLAGNKINYSIVEKGKGLYKYSIVVMVNKL